MAAAAGSMVTCVVGLGVLEQLVQACEAEGDCWRLTGARPSYPGPGRKSRALSVSAMPASGSFLGAPRALIAPHKPPDGAGRAPSRPGGRPRLPRPVAAPSVDSHRIPPHDWCPAPRKTFTAGSGTYALFEGAGVHGAPTSAAGTSRCSQGPLPRRRSAAAGRPSKLARWLKHGRTAGERGKVQSRSQELEAHLG